MVLKYGDLVSDTDCNFIDKFLPKMVAVDESNLLIPDFAPDIVCQKGKLFLAFRNSDYQSNLSDNGLETCDIETKIFCQPKQLLRMPIRLSTIIPPPPPPCVSSYFRVISSEGPPSAGLSIFSFMPAGGSTLLGGTFPDNGSDYNGQNWRVIEEIQLSGASDSSAPIHTFTTIATGVITGGPDLIIADFGVNKDTIQVFGPNLPYYNFFVIKYTLEVDCVH